ncbi:MAG: mercury resistance system transport protein MerF [Fischerella sp.]|jgi:mercuric ion transport protein|uniref:mercury resistance system transport protein MerF n=1 Tax=Fischerella sp. TaxID=1191 RepID=UPI0017AA4A97|nr:mercury resistance system transport protein MerF [Fischerella sp.]NWF61589.1 mercury resistance system transport protein MerF [Fischerella sp.]
MKPKVAFWASVSGTVIVALCCFTPVLVVTLSAIGLGVVIGYLDYILLPALVVMLIITFVSYRRYRRGGMQQ